MILTWNTIVDTAPGFVLQSTDSGSGAVNTTPQLATGSAVATFTRATVAETMLSTGNLSSIASGTARSTYSGSTYLGYLAEGTRTNVALQSQTLGTTWAVSNALDMNAVVADQYVAPDGTTTMDQLSTKATNAAHYLKQAFTFTVAKYTLSCYLKYVATQRWAALAFNDGTTTWAGSFDLLNGVVGALGANTTSTITATSQSTVFLCTISSTANALAAAGNIYISMNSTDSATLESWSAAGTELLGAWGAQLEAATFPSTYIPTTTVAVARNADVDQYVSSNNVPTNDFTVYGEVVWTVIPTAASYFLWASYVDASNYTAILWDGTNLIARKRIAGANHDATKAMTPVAGTRVKYAGRFTSTSGTDIFHTGAVGTNDATNTACQIGTNFEEGSDGNGANQPFAALSNRGIFPAVFTNARIIVMTT